MISDYIYELGLEQLTRVDNYKFIARCPICGDSKKSKIKKRFYILLNKEQVFCHNCGYSATLEYFIKSNYQDVWKQYLTDEVFNKKPKNKIKEVKQEVKNIYSNSYKGLKKAKDIKFVMNYLKKRKLEKFKHKFLYCDNFSSFYNKIKYGVLKPGEYDPRLIIPFIKNDTKEIYAYQGRSLINKSPKYLTLIMNEKYGKLYNYYNLNKDKRIYIVEGPIDSLFLHNSFALCGTTLNKKLFDEIKNFKDVVYVPDTDFIYNNEVLKNLNVFVKNNIKIYIPNDKYKIYKDINDLIISGLQLDEVKKLIDNNIYMGILAIAKLSKFRIKGDIL